LTITINVLQQMTEVDIIGFKMSKTKTISIFDIGLIQLQKLFLVIIATLVTFISYNIYKIEKSDQYFFENEDLSAIESENILYSDDCYGSGIPSIPKKRVLGPM